MIPDEQVEYLIPHAMRLVGAVHDDGPLAVAAVLDGLGPALLPGLAVVLAAMVDPDKTARELLGWVEDHWTQDALFDTAVGATDPHTWPDHICRELWLRSRRVGEDKTPRVIAGYREYERRRGIRRRGITWETRAVNRGVPVVVESSERRPQ